VVDITEPVVELDFCHVGSKLQQRLLEVSLLRSDLLAVAIASDLNGAGQRQASQSLLCGNDAAEVEGLEVEVGRGAVIVVGAELGAFVSVTLMLVLMQMFLSLPHADPEG